MKAEDSPRRTSRDEQRERTHSGMLQRAVELIRQEGVAGVSVSRITKSLKVHRSLFYAHFESLDHCLAEAAHQVLSVLTPIDAELRASISFGEPDALAEFLDGALGRWMQERPFVEILVSARLDRSAFGETLRPTFATIRSELASELWDLLATMGVPGRHMTRVHALADAVYAQWLWGLECLVEERFHDRRMVAEMVADGMYPLITRAVARMRSRPRGVMIADHFSPEQRAIMSRGRDRLLQVVDGQTEDQILSGFDSAEAAVDFFLEATCACFVPEIAAGQMGSVDWVVETQAGTVLRQMVVKEGTCLVGAFDERAPGRCQLRGPLGVFLECMLGGRTFFNAFAKGDLRVEADALFGSEFETWFFKPGEEVC